MLSPPAGRTATPFKRQFRDGLRLRLYKPHSDQLPEGDNLFVVLVAQESARVGGDRSRRRFHVLSTFSVGRFSFTRPRRRSGPHRGKDSRLCEDQKVTIRTVCSRNVLSHSDLPVSLLSVISRRGNDYFFADGSGTVRLVSMQSAGPYLTLGLEDGRRVEVEKRPVRPENLGDPAFAGWVIGTMVAVISSGLFFVAFLLYRAMQYANYLSEPTNDPKAVIRAALEVRYGVLVLFILTSALTFEWPIKSINLLMSDVKNRDPVLFDRMRLVFESTPMAKWDSLVDALTEATEQL